MTLRSSPRGVTTNSAAGVESYEIYYDVFKAMEEEGLVLNLHGEVPSNLTNVHTCLLPSSSVRIADKVRLRDRESAF